MAKIDSSDGFAAFIPEDKDQKGETIADFSKGYCEGYEAGYESGVQTVNPLPIIAMKWIHDNVKADVFSTDIRSLRMGSYSVLCAMADAGLILLSAEIRNNYEIEKNRKEAI